MTRRPDQVQLEREPEEKGPSRQERAPMRGVWNWFGAVFGIVVLLGVGILYFTGRSGLEIDEAGAAEQPVTAEEAEAQPAEPPATVAPADEATGEAAEESPVSIHAQPSAVLLGMYVVDSFGFHGLEEAYAEATEVGDGDAGQVAQVLAAVDAVDWPGELSEAVTTFRADVAGLHEALEAGDLEGARLGLEAVHGSQHDLSNGVYEWLGTAEPDGSTSAVLLGMYVVDSFGFHGLEEAYAEATEVGDGDAGQVAQVLAAVDAVDWPDDLGEFAATFRGDVAGLHEALEAGDLEGARLGLEAVHGSQHDLSNGVYAWLAGTPVGGHDDGVQAGQSMEVIEIEMTEFAYGPESIDIEAGVPVILRFTNAGKLEHEAMVGDAHMQDEWAAAGKTAGHDPTDGHHGDLMAVTVLPGETADLEVHIDQPGTWYMACHLTGHYEQGQVATINVTS